MNEYFKQWLKRLHWGEKNAHFSDNFVPIVIHSVYSILPVLSLSHLPPELPSSASKCQTSSPWQTTAAGPFLVSSAAAGVKRLKTSPDARPVVCGRHGHISLSARLPHAIRLVPDTPDVVVKKTWLRVWGGDDALMADGQMERGGSGHNLGPGWAGCEWDTTTNEKKVCVCDFSPSGRRPGMTLFCSTGLRLQLVPRLTALLRAGVSPASLFLSLSPSPVTRFRCLIQERNWLPASLHACCRLEAST